MKILVFDCFSGISGDMTIGAFLDAGVPFRYLKKELSKLGLRGYFISVDRVRRGFLEAVKFNVKVPHHPSHQHTPYSQIDQMIRSAKLAKKDKDLSRRIFLNLAKAESKIHGIKISKVHFHEVGAVDSIIDIVGTSIACGYFGIEKGYAFQLVDGKATGTSAGHHVFPVPAPAALELLKGFKIDRTHQAREMITPTGAAIVASLCDSRDSQPVSFILENVGYGAGDFNDPKLPNCTRISVGTMVEAVKKDRVIMLETNIDNLPPFAFEKIYENLFKAGALDVFVETVLMKKMRPAFKLSVIMPLHLRSRISEVLLKDTPTLGVRYYELERDLLDRKIVPFNSMFGRVRIKEGWLNSRNIKSAPEYEDVKRIAERYKRSILEVYRKIQNELNLAIKAR